MHFLSQITWTVRHSANAHENVNLGAILAEWVRDLSGLPESKRGVWLQTMKYFIKLWRQSTRCAIMGALIRAVALDVNQMTHLRWLLRTLGVKV